MQNKLKEQLTEMLQQSTANIEGCKLIQPRDFRRMVAAYRCSAQEESEELSCSKYQPNGKGCAFAQNEFGLKTCLYTGVA